MHHLLEARNRIAEEAVRSAVAPEGTIGRSYSVHRAQQDMRLALMLSLTQNIPIGRRFADQNDLALWAYERLAEHPRGMDVLLRDRAALVVEIMWMALEQGGGAEHIEDHGGYLLDIALRTRRAYYREDSALRASLQAVAV